MQKIIFSWIFILSFFFTQAQSVPAIQSDFPDPTVIYANNKYYAYATNTNYMGKLLHIQVAVSDDMKTWKIIGDALPQKPMWGSGDYWAPHVLYDKSLNKYVLFYSAETIDVNSGKALGVAFSDTPEGPFIDKGTPILLGPGFQEIDPFAIIDKSKNKFLIWGSDSQPIKIQEMNAGWTDFKKGSKASPLLFPKKENKYTNLLEGAWIDYDNGFYYLYYSGDNCCGENASYAVLVARAKKIKRPYITLGQFNKTGTSVILEKNDYIVAPGHNSIIKDKKGVKWIAYHAIPKNNFDKKNYSRYFYLSKIKYVNGWPIVTTK